MAQYDKVENQENDACENDWLSVSYTAKRYAAKKTKKAKKGIFVAMAICLLVVAVACGFLFADNFNGDFFASIRQSFASAFPSFAVKEQNYLTVPCVSCIDNVENGVITFSGGRTVLSFCDGVVSQVDSDALTVQIDENTSIVYGGLTDIYVSVGDKVEKNRLLGKYSLQATAQLVFQGEPITKLVGSETQITWEI